MSRKKEGTKFASIKCCRPPNCRCVILNFEEEKVQIVDTDIHNLVIESYDKKASLEDLLDAIQLLADKIRDSRKEILKKSGKYYLNWDINGTGTSTK